MTTDDAAEKESVQRRGARAAEPKSANEQQLATERLHRVTAVLAHELRNPLSVLQAGIELMDDGDHEIGSLKRIFQPQVEQMTRLVQDLSDMSRSADGKVRIDRRPMDLRPRVNDAIKSVEQIVATRAQRIVTKFGQEPLWINGDPQRMTQTTANLLSNASKYSDHGSEIEVSVSRVKDDFVEIRVRDHGIGIDAENLANVFEFFSQVTTTESLEHADGGLGIGLGLVRTLVEMHDGNVWAASEGIGKGSEFVVQLPCCEPPKKPYQERHAKRCLSPTRVLVVDDQRANLYVIKILLKRMGVHDVRCVADAEAALSELNDFVPDIVLLDLGLPGISGLDLARQMRKLPQCQETLFVALTGYDDDTLRSEASAAGIDQYRIKPVSMRLLEEILEYHQATANSQVQP